MNVSNHNYGKWWNTIERKNGKLYTSKQPKPTKLFLITS